MGRDTQTDNTTKLKIHQLVENITKAQIHLFYTPKLFLFHYVITALTFNALFHVAFGKKRYDSLLDQHICKVTGWLEHKWCGHFKGYLNL